VGEQGCCLAGAGRQRRLRRGMRCRPVRRHRRMPQRISDPRRTRSCWSSRDHRRADLGGGLLVPAVGRGATGLGLHG
jgi:hypothetical protein